MLRIPEDEKPGEFLHTNADETIREQTVIMAKLRAISSKRLQLRPKH